MTQMQRMSLNAQIKPCTVPSKQEETEFTLPTKPYLKTQHKLLKKITRLINIIAASSTKIYSRFSCLDLSNSSAKHGCSAQRVIHTVKRLLASITGNPNRPINYGKYNSLPKMWL